MKKRITVPFSMIMVLLFFVAGNLMAQPKIIFISDDNNDNYNLEFLQNQGLDVTKFWVPADVNTWGVDTLAMLDAADLVIVGRSVGSGSFQDSIEAATWDNIDAPMIYCSPYFVRSSRNQWLNTTTTNKILAGTKATAVIPGDAVFNNVTLDADDMVTWFDHNSNGIENDSAHNGTVVAQVNDSVPLLIRWDADVAFYEGSRDTADGPRVYFGFGIEPEGVSAQTSHFPISKAAKQIYLNEITRILGIPEQVAVYGAPDYKAIFISDDDNDNYNLEFLQNQGLQITKFWVPADVNTWGADTLAMLDAAELVIVGRSVGSGSFQDSIEAATWDNIDAPMIYCSPYFVRSSRNQWLNTTTTNVIPGGTKATAVLPGDVVFNDVTLDADDMLTWFDINSNGIENDSAHNGTVVAQVNDSVPLLIRWDANVAFYEGSRDTADGERVYFGFGIEPEGVTAQQSHFPISKAAKTVYLAEIARILGFTPAAPKFSAPDFTITFLNNSNDFDATQKAWLKDQGFGLNSFYGSGNISTWTEDTIAIVNNSDIVIIGRSVGSTQSQDSIDRVVWNAIPAPVIWNSPWACRNTRNNMFNSSTTASFDGNTKADVKIIDDPVLAFSKDAGKDRIDWFVNNGDYILDNSGTGNGTVVVTQGDTIPFLVRFAPDVPFYEDGPDSAVGPRTYFGFGMEPAANYFPLSQNAQAVYFAEILRMLGADAYAPVLYGTDMTLKALTIDQGTLVPDFSPDVLSYTMEQPWDVDSLDIVATPTEASSAVEGAGAIEVLDDMTVYIKVTSQIGQYQTYSLAITKGDDPGTGDAIDANFAENLRIYPNPFNDQVIIRATEDINFVEITDLQGKVVYSMNVNDTDVELNLNDLNSGIYFIRTQTSERNYVNKIIKN